MHVVTGTPYGLFSLVPYDLEYVVLVQGTGIIYCPTPIDLENLEFVINPN